MKAEPIKASVLVAASLLGARCARPNVEGLLESLDGDSRIALPSLRDILAAGAGKIADTAGNLILKNISQATPSTNNPTTGSTSYATVPEMTLTFTTKGNKVLITFWFVANSSASTLGFFALFRDGVQLTNDFEIAGALPVSITYVDSPSAASHTFDARWKTSTGQTAVGLGLARQFQAVELG